MQEKKIVLKVFGLGVIKGYLIIVYNTQVDNPFPTSAWKSTKEIH